MKRSNRLLDVALLLCPRAFRKNYREEIYDHVVAETRAPGNVLALALNIALSGIVAHAENLSRHLLYAIRALARSPLYTVVTIAVMGLAIAANVAVAAVLHGVLLRPLPFPEQYRLVQFGYATNAGDDQPSYPEAAEVASRATTFARVGWARRGGAVLSGFGAPTMLRGRIVSSAYLDLLGARTLVGRRLSTSDLGSRHVVIVESLARRIGNGDVRAALGKIVRLDDIGYTVIGVLADDFRDPARGGLATNDYWLPVNPAREERGAHSYFVVAQLRPGVIPLAAQTDTERTVMEVVRAHPDDFDPGTHARVLPLADVVVGPIRPTLELLFVAVLLVLLIACANVGSMALVRATSRERDFTVRAALGASRTELVMQLFTESIMLSVVAGFAGLIAGAIALRAFALLGTRVLPRWESVGFDAAVLVYAALLVLAAAIVVGILPGFLYARTRPSILKGGARSGTRRTTKQLLSMLVVGEVTFAIVLLVSGGLILRSFFALSFVDPGFKTRDVYVATVSVPATHYGDPLALVAFDRRLSSALAMLPGVRNAVLTGALPFAASDVTDLQHPGHDVPLGTAEFDKVAPPYFRTLGIPLLRGRFFDDRDTPRSAQVAIISASLARRYFGSVDVIGRQIAPEQTAFHGQGYTRTIVGVVGDVRGSLSGPLDDTVYAPLAQFPGYRVQILIRTNGLPDELSANIDAVLSKIDPDIVHPRLAAFQAIIDETTARPQAAMIVFVALACVALLLVLAGIYAVSAYSVQQRMHEFGIRKAIGARSSSIARQVVRHALAMTVTGALGGLTICAASARVLKPLLFQTSAFDPTTLVGAVTVATACTIAAAFVPALRATRADPAITLRYE